MFGGFSLLLWTAAIISFIAYSAETATLEEPPGDNVRKLQFMFIACWLLIISEKYEHCIGDFSLSLPLVCLSVCVWEELIKLSHTLLDPDRGIFGGFFNIVR